MMFARAPNASKEKHTEAVQVEPWKEHATKHDQGNSRGLLQQDSTCQQFQGSLDLAHKLMVLTGPCWHAGTSPCFAQDGGNWLPHERPVRVLLLPDFQGLGRGERQFQTGLEKCSAIRTGSSHEGEQEVESEEGDARGGLGAREEEEEAQVREERGCEKGRGYALRVHIRRPGIDRQQRPWWRRPSCVCPLGHCKSPATKP